MTVSDVGFDHLSKGFLGSLKQIGSQEFINTHDQIKRIKKEEEVYKCQNLDGKFYKTILQRF
jgi:hypothetical protein